MSGSWPWCWSAALVYAVVLAAAWAFGPWWFVLALASAGVVLVRRRIVARRQLPTRLAAWAVHAPRGLSPPAALEHAIAVDLASVSQGQLDCLDRAHSVIADRVDDAWRRALAAERLDRAHDLVAEGRLVGVTARCEPRSVRLCRSAVVVVLIVLLTLGNLTQWPGWLLSLAVLSILLTLEMVDLYERRRVLPELLASRSVQDPVEGLFVMFEHDVARSLVALARNDRVVLRRAQCLVDAASEPGYAHQRLMEAERLLTCTAQGRPRSGLSAWLLFVLTLATGPRFFGGRCSEHRPEIGRRRARRLVPKDHFTRGGNA